MTLGSSLHVHYFYEQLNNHKDSWLIEKLFQILQQRAGNLLVHKWLMCARSGDWDEVLKKPGAWHLSGQVHWNNPDTQKSYAKPPM
jgi:hypothetical protein